MARKKKLKFKGLVQRLRREGVKNPEGVQRECENHDKSIQSTGEQSWQKT